MSRGARFILNCKFKHVAQPGEPLGEHTWTPTHIERLIEYTGTRETVALNFDEEKGAEPATQKQIDKIEEFIREAKLNNESGQKELNDLPQYLDYKAEPTKQNASELISYLAEQIMINGGFDEASNLIEYTALRPGVVKVGEHGLFSSHPIDDLKKTAKEFSSHKGNIYTHILSIRREDADRLGYDSQKPWKNLILSKIDVIAKHHGISVSDMHWVAAMHNTGEHPHVHLYLYADENAPKKPYLDENGIKKMKSKFASEIFRDDRMNIYHEKKLYKKELKAQSSKLLDALLENPLKDFENDKLNELVNKVNKLSENEELPTKGKQYYGFMPAEIKKMVDDIQCHLVYDNKILNSLYQNYCNCQYNIEKIYVTNPREQAPIDKVEAFIPIKNEILRHAYNIRDGANQIIDNGYVESENIMDVDSDSFSSETTSPVNVFVVEDDYSDEPIVDVPQMSNNNPFDTINSFENNHQKGNYRKHLGYKQLSKKFSFIKDCELKGDYAEKSFASLKIISEDINLRTGETCRELADRYYYGNGCARDINAAFMWYGIAADQYKDSYACYKLGQIYYNGTDEIEINQENGYYYSKTAYLLFQQEIENSEFFTQLSEGKENLDYYSKVSADDAYKEYLIGRLYLKGQGLEQDYYKAYCSFSLSAQNGYNHANYYIGNMYYYGLGFEQSFVEAKSFYDKAADNGDNYAKYRLARMYIKGEGTDVDLNKSEVYLKTSLNFVVMANYDLAKLYELHTDEFKHSDDEIYQLYKTALKGLEKQEKDMHDTFTEIRIGNMYLNGQGTEANVNKAVEWLNKAAEQDNPDALYQLGYIYSSDKYSIVDEEKAFDYYARALKSYIKAEEENANATAEYRISRMYLKGIGTEVNSDEAIKWFTKAALNHNGEAAYQLYKLYSDGALIEQNSELAGQFLEMACYLDNPYAQYALGNIELENGNLENSIKWLKESAEKEMPFASYKLGSIYGSEEYSVFDEALSQKYYEAALSQFQINYEEQADDYLAYRIGNMYLNGQGTEANVNKAVEWLNKAAEQDNPDALYQLGYINYSESYGINDKSSANEYFLQSLKIYFSSFEADPDGNKAYRIGTMYHYGLGVERNIDEAIKWYKKSIELGNLKAQEKIDEINENKNASLMAIATTAAHLGRMIDTETHAAFKQRYSSDSKILRQEKLQKINLGQAIGDRAQSFDY
ncbi:MAG: SEL1-like repeat protein [Ruminococcus sp.]|nr:SEL1-like repeat protein [Ruminococcus sp.]